MIDFIERLDKEREYKAYLEEHISGVEDAFCRLIMPLKHKYSKEVDEAIDLCQQQVPLHDLSKLSKLEFDQYRAWHYPTKEEERHKEDYRESYEKAWLHHKTVNPHHPIYWTMGEEKEDMPLSYIFEMLCDWSSVSKHLNLVHHEDTSIVDFYDNKAVDEKAAFTPHTKELVDYWIDEIYRKPGIKY